MAKETVICTYRVRIDAEEEFRRLLRRHWSELLRLGFVTADQPLQYRQTDEPTYVEIFTWIDGGFALAHEHPDVLEIWEQMDPLLEERDGQQKWDFPHYLPAHLEA